MQRDFKGIWIPKELCILKDLSLLEKVMLIEIDSLDNENGCYASNDYFADFFGLSKDRISKVINNLVKRGFISSELKYKIWPHSIVDFLKEISHKEDSNKVNNISLLILQEPPEKVYFTSLNSTLESL